MEKLYTKHGMHNRCILAISRNLEKLNCDPKEVLLGEVELEMPLTAKQMKI